MLRTITRITLAVFIAAYGIYALATVDRRSDEEQLRSLVTATAAAVADHDSSGAVRCLSKDFKGDGGMTYDQLRVLVVQALNNDLKYTTQARIDRIAVHGDSAIVDVHALVQNSSNGNAVYDRDLSLKLRKESARHALIIPVKVWRVVGAGNLGLSEELL